ncbi:UNVERIFIED_CONTAM: hypothetical protein FKN15_028138 [Acipenser sinensis]
MVTCSMIIGLIFTPVGWVLLLAATVTPQWREFPQRPGYSLDLFFYDGLWETCREVTTLHVVDSAPEGYRNHLCGHGSPELPCSPPGGPLVG